MIKLFFASIVVLSITGCGEASKTDDAATPKKKDPEPKSSFKVSGTLILSEDIDATTADQYSLEKGKPIKGAEIFVKGHPSDSTKTDSDGAFKLKVSIDKALHLKKKTTSSYTVLMWYTVESTNANATAQARFGAKKDIDVSFTDDDLNSVKLKDTQLTYTMGLHVPVVAEGSETPLENCTVTVVGFDDKLKVINRADGSGYYDLDYLPADKYDISFECPGYKDQIVEDYVVNAATALDAWQTLPTVKMVVK